MKQRTKFSGKPWCLMLLLTLLLIWSAPAVAAGEKDISGAAEMPCRGLKPFNNLDELLYQFYINLDSDCLFKMPMEELEKIWDTKIFHITEDQAKVTHEDQLAKMEEPFYHMPYKSEHDAFYIKIVRNEKTGLNAFAIKITKEYFDKYATLFPDGIFPRMLPEPIIKGPPLFIFGSGGIPLKKKQKVEKMPGKYDPFSHHYWVASEKSYAMHLGGEPGITFIAIR